MNDILDEIRGRATVTVPDNGYGSNEACPKESTGAVMPEPALFTARELSAYLHVSEKTIRKHTDAGRLPVVRFGRCLRFPKIEIDKRILSGDMLR